MNNNPNLSQSASQKRQILELLKTGQPITAHAARYLFQCDRCAARIEELRDAGHNIKTDMIRLPSGKRVARYSLATETAE